MSQGRKLSFYIIYRMMTTVKERTRMFGCNIKVLFYVTLIHELKYQFVVILSVKATENLPSSPPPSHTNNTT